MGWVWPLSDPVTHEKVLLVCEQNITQVRGVRGEGCMMWVHGVVHGCMSAWGRYEL
jgi:hypothetical protein